MKNDPSFCIFDYLVVEYRAFLRFFSWRPNPTNAERMQVIRPCLTAVTNQKWEVRVDERTHDGCGRI